MSKLPIESVLKALIAEINANSQIILKAPPGAGKSTYLPLQLLQLTMFPGKIVMLEPRRLAARNIAHFLAKQIGEKVGESVGFRVRGETKVSAKTKLEVVTEGVMTRMIQSDPELQGIDLLIFDEFHERSIHADTALAFALESQEALREDLKILVMSATLEQEQLRPLLPDAAYIESHGRSFPVSYHYSPLAVNDRLVPRIASLIKQAINNESGSILVFLPSVQNIHQLESELNELPEGVNLYPLYGRLNFAQQELAIAPCQQGERKVVLATNIAETSLTIEGIRVVIDSGLERVARFDLKTGITKLEEGRIAQSSAIQRAGRAGRIEEGVCIRLYSEEQFKQQPIVPKPEILHSDLAPLCMELAHWGTANISDMKWLNLPPKVNIEQGQQLLVQLGLMSEKGKLSKLGEEAHRLGLEPRLAAMLLKIKQQAPNLLSTALAVIPLVEENNQSSFDLSRLLYQMRVGKTDRNHAVLRRINSLASTLNTRFERSHIEEEEAGLCLALAFPDRIAQLRSGRDGAFLLANGHGGHVDIMEPLSSNDYLVAVSLMRSHSDTSRVFSAAPLNIESLQEANPELFQQSEQVEWDEKRGRLTAEQQTKLGRLIVARKALPTPDKEKMTQALLNYVRSKGLSALNWTEASTSLLIRMRCGKQWLDEKAWPDVTEKGMLDNLELWLEPFMNNVSSLGDLKRIDLTPVLASYLGWPLSQEIDTLLPSHYLLPTGSRRLIRYQEGAEPILSARIQELFGEKSSPVVAEGRKKVVLELLSPAQRPLQVTSDLAGFWAGSYKQVQKEMKGRYPKHPWPDDPANHIATTKTKRQLNK